MLDFQLMKFLEKIKIILFRIYEIILNQKNKIKIKKFITHQHLFKYKYLIQINHH